MEAKLGKTCWRQACAISLVVAMVLALGSHAAAQSGVQIAPDGSRLLISKDLGGQRWAINRTFENGAVTGNVFSPGGGKPQFVYCEQLSLSDGVFTFRCYGADECPLVPCVTQEEWAALGEVSLPETFFRAEQREAVDGLEGVPPLGERLGASAASSPSGAQVSVPGGEILVSKDVGAERWAISYEPETGRIVGNVFRAGSEPAFVFCRRESGGEPATFRCFGADKCPNDECAPSDWSDLGEFPVPSSFFEAPGELNLRAVVDSLAAAFGGEDLDVYLNAVERGYSFRQIARAAQAQRLRSDGTIEDRAGGIVESAFAPQILFSPTASGETALGKAEQPFGARPTRAKFAKTISEMIRAGGDTETSVGQLVLLLAANGYTAEQIVVDVLGNPDRVVFVSGCLLPTGANVCRFPEQEFALIDLETEEDLQPEGPEAMILRFCGNLRLDEGEECDFREHDKVCDASRQTRFSCNERCRMASRPAAPGECDPAEGTELFCGDGERDGFETCEPDGPLRCSAVSGTGVGCNADCTARLVECPGEQRCGNGRIEPANDEECEQQESDFECHSPGFRQLVCTSTCTREIRSCDELPEPPPMPWVYQGTLTRTVGLEAPFGSISHTTRCPISVTLDAAGNIDGEFACPETIRTTCPDQSSGEPGGFSVANSSIVTVIEGAWFIDRSFELDAVNTAVTTPFEGAFTLARLSSVRDLGTREFQNCGVTISGTNLTTLDLSRAAE